MDRKEIHELAKQILGPNTELIDQPEWVSMCCPLAAWTHEKGVDHNPSAGVSVQVGKPSIFNCLSAETMVMTRDGDVPISELSGRRVELLTTAGWVLSTVASYGVQPLQRVVMSRNGVTRVEYATAGHRWFARSQGSSGKYTERTTSELRAGNRMQSVLPKRRSEWSFSADGVVHGVIFGDGSRHCNGRHGTVNLYGNKMELHEWFSGYRTTWYLDEQRPYVRCCGELAYAKNLPPTDSTDEYLLGFIAGYLATDGCVSKSGTVTISCATRETLEWLRAVATRLGLVTYGIKTQMRVGYGSHESALYSLCFVNSTLHESLFLRADHKARYVGNVHAYDRLGWQVVSVEDSGRVEEVYCAEVPVHHAFALKDNLLTGNCFTCHRKGTVSWLLRQLERYSGEEWEGMAAALEKGEFYGGEIPEWGAHDVKMVPQPIDASVYLDLYDSAADHPYLKTRGISPGAALEMGLLHDPGDNGGTERILFPVYGYDRQLYGFSGRDVTGKAKLRVKDYHGLPKKHMLLGSHLLQPNDEYVVLTEGLFDYAKMVEYGEPGVAMMCSSLTEEQAEILKDIGKPVYFFHDDDQAGLEARDTAREQLWKYVPVLKVRYPKECTVETKEGDLRPPKDPAELSRKQVRKMIQDARLM